MEEFMQSDPCREAAEFHCPRYRELPALELYMDQVLTLVESVLRPLCGEEGEPWVTGPMVNNYTKQGLLERPVKKKYSREHLAYLIFICSAKQVLSIPDIQKLLQVQRETYPLPVAYDYFCTELENALQAAFVTRTLPEDTASRDTQQTRITRALVTALAQKVYLNKFLEYTVRSQREKQGKA
ncbi:DUF1836 domain-containing protein [Fournierella massiliensis]|nr:DUF1836 domain-containing protein [Fournierella massiliensis]MCF2557249.1 DUF1836 domain-containing protein [Fournierella massiliensis]